MDGSTSQFVLRITQGATQFPERPLTGQRFVIGGGSHCQLQIGGAFPFVHSVLSRNEQGWAIEAMVPWPLLMVNGQSVRSVHLQLGDDLQIGEIGLRVELAQEMAEVTPTSVDLTASEELPGVMAVAPAPQELSVEELADRLTTAIDEVVAHEQRRRRGWERLLAAAKQVGRDESGSPKLAGSTLDLLTAEVEQLRRREAELQGTIAQMQARQQALEAEVAALQAALHPTPGPQLRMSA